MGPSTFWFLLLLSVVLVSIHTRVDGVRARDIQTLERVPDLARRFGSTGSKASPPWGAQDVTICSIWRKPAPSWGGRAEGWLGPRVGRSGQRGLAKGRSSRR